MRSNVGSKLSKEAKYFGGFQRDNRGKVIHRFVTPSR